MRTIRDVTFTGWLLRFRSQPDSELRVYNLFVIDSFLNQFEAVSAFLSRQWVYKLSFVCVCAETVLVSLALRLQCLLSGLGRSLLFPVVLLPGSTVRLLQNLLVNLAEQGPSRPQLPKIDPLRHTLRSRMQLEIGSASRVGFIVRSGLSHWPPVLLRHLALGDEPQKVPVQARDQLLHLTHPLL